MIGDSSNLGCILPGFLSCISFFLFLLSTSSLSCLAVMTGERTDQYQPENKISYRNNTDNYNKLNVYIVYMGSLPPASTSQQQTQARRETSISLREHHLKLLASFLQVDRKAKQSIHYGAAEAEKRLVHSYSHGFSGFAARLTKEEATRAKSSSSSSVVSVFIDPVFQLHTTRSWDFLQLQNDLIINNKNYDQHATASANLHDSSVKPTATDDLGVDTIIGLLDTGIWPESESFNDKGMGPVPSRWKGVCMQGHDFIASTNCNRKLIGARYYNDSTDDEQLNSPRDTIGHGTHTASTAAGASVAGASYYGLGTGTAKGGSPGSRIAIYQVCTSRGCRGSSIMAAFDDAIGDGVDVLSLSLGASAFMRPDFSSDPIAIGAFHAVQKGITVVCSAGNDGPTSSTIVNTAPWILTVAATTIDRDLESDAILGGIGNAANKVIKGESINFSNLKKSPVYPLIHAGSAKSNSSSQDEARNCNPDSLESKKINGTIVVCEHSDSSYTKKEKMEEVREKGGIGLILIDDLERFVAFPYGAFPLTVVSSKESTEILSYINSTKNPVATVLPTVTVTKYKPAPAVAYFSSRGPSLQTSNLLKPDIAAPGVNILAAWIGTNDTSEAPAGQKPSPFNLLSGTSMSCPHVAGIAATIKARNPSWSPSAIRSAIMTTATQTNNEQAMLTADSGSTATPYDYGAGEVNPSGALQPGLVYETDADDYLLFLCNYGYKVSDIKLISSNVPNGFDCPKNSSKNLVSQLNYPSIAISKLNGKESKNVTRTVTNVGPEDETSYTVTVNSPQEVEVKVVPSKLQFSKSSNKQSYQVIFSPSSSVTRDLFGSITWSNGKYKVRTAFVIATSS
ncbi:hypothetical protein MKX03_035518 [Papaver bracteatum]|nr:hypothetical protein MKX03_035518 [Papaver bracteatum]